MTDRLRRIEVEAMAGGVCVFCSRAVGHEALGIKVEHEPSCVMAPEEPVAQRERSHTCGADDDAECSRPHGRTCWTCLERAPAPPSDEASGEQTELETDFANLRERYVERERVHAHVLESIREAWTEAAFGIDEFDPAVRVLLMSAEIKRSSSEKVRLAAQPHPSRGELERQQVATLQRMSRETDRDQFFRIKRTGRHTVEIHSSDIRCFDHVPWSEAVSALATPTTPGKGEG